MESARTQCATIRRLPNITMRLAPKESGGTIVVGFYVTFKEIQSFDVNFLIFAVTLKNNHKLETLRKLRILHSEQTPLREYLLMRFRLAIIIILFLFAGCATFKELKPIPPIQPGERGYIELRNDREKFQLKQGSKYFIKFPRPLDAYFYLILQTNAKHAMHNYCTAAFNDGKPPILPMTDEAADVDSVSVFAVDTSNAFTYWVIDSVWQNISLNMRYRYVPQWRYTVENKYDLYRRILAENKCDRRPYETMGPQFDFAAFDPASEQQKLRTKIRALSDMNRELLKLEQLFPSNIATSRDTMYLRYVGLRDDTKDELKFQTDYDAILSVLRAENETKGDFVAFIKRAREFEDVLAQKDRFRAPILEHIKSYCLQRLEEAMPLYDSQLRKKSDISAIELKPPIADVGKLYVACGQKLPPELMELNEYVDEFNSLAEGVQNAEDALNSANSAVQKKTPWPENSFYPGLNAKLDGAKVQIPENKLDSYGRYKDLKITSTLGERARDVAQRITQREVQFQRAADIVQRINAIRPQKDYKGIIQILRTNRDLSFVLAHYSDVDALLLKSQTEKIRARLDARDWSGTEDGLANLLNDRDYLNFAQISMKKMQAIQSIESDLFEQVRNITYARADSFAQKNERTIDNVPALYADSALLPVYTLTFSSESPEKAAQKRRTIDSYLNELKTIRFPEASIRIIYRELIQAPREHGVEKARAILAHAKFYKGKDKSVRNSIDECDPNIAKTLAKPKDYRRVFVIPVNETAKASNEYLFRVNVKIPSDAKFPVYDINIKVPSVIAESAGKKQWFTKILLNKKVVKTEGHMRITAPMADNNYEAQITPVQVSKDRDNIIEIQFNYPTFQLFEVSFMAQVPLIRKD